MSSYPLTLETQYMDVSTLLETFMGQAVSESEHENDAVYQKAMVYEMINSLNTSGTSENDLTAFKEFLEWEYADETDDTGLSDAVSGIQYTYDTDLLVYTENVDGTIIRSDSQELMQELLVECFGVDLSSMLNLSEEYGMTAASAANMSAMSPMSTSVVLWQEMLSGKDGSLISPLLEKQYDVIYGSWPSVYNEIVLVVDENNEIDDMTLYALGLKSKSSCFLCGSETGDESRGADTHHCNGFLGQLRASAEIQAGHSQPTKYYFTVKRLRRYYY